MPELYKGSVEGERGLKKLKAVMKNSLLEPFEYKIREDTLLIYDNNFQVVKEVPHCMDFLTSENIIHPDDRWKVAEFFQGGYYAPVELRVLGEDQHITRKIIQASLYVDEKTGEQALMGSARDITGITQRDSLTNLYNQETGKKLIEEYLVNKSPYDTCGLIIIDIDYFKSVNDTYGHLTGDAVLRQVGQLFQSLFRYKSIVVRAGGDEFVILLKEIHLPELVQKSMELIKAVREMRFEEEDLVITCSAGVCYLSENVSGYTYSQVFKNADWALYKAKENGRNQYVFCDSLQRFESMETRREYFDIDTRYLYNDVVATAFEIFEKSNSFPSALELLLEVIGLKLQLDRITLIHTNIRDQKVDKQYQWVNKDTPKVLSTAAGFTKEDFQTLFNSYNEYGVTVLHHDRLEMYSEEGARLLVQGGAKTVVYAAMYCEGRYTGAISYVTCREKRNWSQQSLLQFGEVTKIISAHLEKHLALNVTNRSLTNTPEYDRLTGLISFPVFKEEVERLIVGGHVESHVIVYTDFVNFTYINQKYGYSAGDQLLKEFSHYIISTFRTDSEVYFTRVVADQFIAFLPYREMDRAESAVEAINQGFIAHCAGLFPGMMIKLRSGIYHVTPQCVNLSSAIDSANYARKSLKKNSGVTARLYDSELHQKRVMEEEAFTDIDNALKNREFKIYMQPKYSLEDYSVIGAETLVRWQKKDGRILSPGSFVPIFEANGRIVDLDFYVFEEVASFLAKNDRLGRKQIPISVNASILHAQNADTTKKYLDILKKYNVDPSLVEIELTETDTIEAYDKVREMFHSLSSENIKTALDDFGAGYSLLNSMIDMPVDTIKIDRNFIRHSEQSEKGIHFLQQLISFFLNLGYEVICEGVETREQIELLKEAGCNMGQGYFFSRPVTVEEYERLVYTDRGSGQGD